ncbi:uncharacterized protein PFL1_06204 [Pseudozyma flocculosa PF-1]|uniref:Uncharacterized protein n=2 Tax=Pseudozyma flocculosa TaxID=84751 RepID=A0A5C3FAB2_9BASI|nr:uncharacterized protein PFL1_06204 [Pseudozyma flocculosa PF-1]EPQ26269.1 hypothetical protein PFL1_06204 [Pseudozyma flocculosa PF-1]SPO40229.1 uncharacterized protein PSFLO_05711 [Pseudozyma flocculosa]
MSSKTKHERDDDALPSSPQQPADGGGKRKKVKTSDDASSSAVWGIKEDLVLRQGILQFLHDNRPETHKDLPELDEFRDHGARRITGKINTLLAQLEKEWGCTINRKASKAKST